MTEKGWEIAFDTETICIIARLRTAEDVRQLIAAIEVNAQFLPEARSTLSIGDGG